ncbi:MAG: hypothetical protein P8X55_14075, partial [Desulfosarcinaceae bacterium]
MKAPKQLCLRVCAVHTNWKIWGFRRPLSNSFCPMKGRGIHSGSIWQSEIFGQLISLDQAQ